MRYHFAGAAGAGMSPLARFLAARGNEVSGSDRRFDREGARADGGLLAAAGVRLVPQDGSFAAAGAPGVLVFSSAIEEDNPELAAGQRAGWTARHRAAVLAELAQGGIAVTGTSGKTTTTAMIAFALREAGRDPALVNGAGLLGGEGGGDVLAGGGIFVAEADESDGTAALFAPAIGVVTGAERDHAEIARVREILAAFAGRTTRALALNADCPNLGGLAPAPGARSVAYGFGPAARLRAGEPQPAGAGVAFRAQGVEFFVPQPGRHNAQNALAAAAALREAGLSLAESAALLARFPGVRRRLERIGEAAGVLVLDDYAHNPAKLAAALEAVRRPGGRTIALFRPHGYAPARFHRAGFAAAFRAGLRPDDLLFYLPIYDAGGTAPRTIAAADLAGDLADAPFAVALAEPEAAPAAAAAAARPGDTLLVLGARDPHLGALARAALAALEKRGPAKATVAP